MWKTRGDYDPLSDHQTSYNDKGATGSPRWDRGKDWSEKDRDGEHQTNYDRRDACLATLWSKYVSLTKKKSRRGHLEQYAPTIPVADSMYAVTGEVPKREPIVIMTASTQYAKVDPSKSIVTGSRRPANFAMEYRVLFRTLRHAFPMYQRKRTRSYLERPDVRCNLWKFHVPAHREYPRRAW